jgi:hypothetical protein
MEADTQGQIFLNVVFQGHFLSSGILMLLCFDLAC